jgi:DNA-binding NarL/FixJ family response regulator
MAKVMLVDDVKFMRMLLRDIINSIQSYEVVGECDDGSKVIDEYKKCKPEIVLMDMAMKYNGINATRNLKKFDKRAKIICCTAMGGEEALLKDIIEAGAEKKYITKPFRKEDIEDTLKSII